mmetsp:Transcript_83/g.218  ORF Transcript_83/g.218 Transcript_83/m.218 type:complete len:789 (+) Transcript_83:110-2476(+)
MFLPLLLVSFSAVSSSKIVLQRNVFLAATSTCMILLCWSKSLQHTGNIVTTARAWSTISTGSNRLIRTNTFLTAAATRDDDGEEEVNGSVQKPPEGKTGWNHNPPKNPDFWNIAEQVEEISKSVEESEPKFQTGWLHNTKSPANNGAGTKKNKTSGKKSNNAAGMARRRLEEAMKAQRENHRIVSPGALHSCGKDRQIVVTEHRVSVPIVHTEKEEGTNRPAMRVAMPKSPTDFIDVAFTIVEEIKDEETRAWYETEFPTLTPKQRAAAYVKRCGMTSAKDMLLYLQGGPGFGAPSPVTALCFAKDGGSWGSAALDRYSKVVLLDQRGTGKSSPLTKQSLEQRFPGLFAMDNIAEVVSTDFTDQIHTMDRLEKAHPEEFETFKSSLDETTAFITQFRADNIVRDAEMVKEILMYTPSVDDDEEKDVDDETNADKKCASQPNPWGCSLGQSFGGFCTMTFLSQVQYPPKIILLTGGIAPMLADSAFDVYTSLWKKVKERNMLYYDMYPGDVVTVKTIVRKLLQLEKEGATIRLPSGGKLTARRFLQLGMMLGGSPSSFASMHYLLSSAFLQPISGKDDTNEFSRGFLKAVDNQQPFDEYPIYFWLHESIYADANNESRLGKERVEGDDTDCATRWSADSAYQAKVNQKLSGVDYDYRATSQEDSDLPVLFFGEMVFPWMADDYSECGGVGCTALAHALAAKKDWGPLYDATQMRAALNDGRTRSAAAIYYDDIYVDFDCCMEVTARDGPLEKCKVYITNDYQHSGLRDDGATIFNKLYGMATGSIRTPS